MHLRRISASLLTAAVAVTANAAAARAQNGTEPDIAAMKRDARCRLLQPALRVAFRAPPALGGSTIHADTLSPPAAVSGAPKEQRRHRGV